MLTKKIKDLHKSQNDGFTIIEVLIVLAIAALILVVVLIAVPNLQRSQRNSARKDEASRILTAANNYVANNNGNPLTAGSDTTAGAIIQDSGKLQQYSGLAKSTNTTLTANKVSIAVITAAVDNSTYTSSADAILIAQGGACDTTTPGNLTKATSARQVVLVYTLEQSNGRRSVACIGS